MCLTDFFFGQDTLPPTKSAFSQTRSFLCYKVFKMLSLLICRLFYDQGNFEFRVLSIDSSTLRLPDQLPLREKFSQRAFGAKRTANRWMSRISFLYDLLNNLIIDALMESFDTSEATLCQQHLGILRKGDLVFFDRYYASHYMFSILLHKQVHFIFRMRDHSWKCVKEFINLGQMEQIVDLAVYHYSPVAKKIPAIVDRNICIRLAKQVSKSGEVRVYATSLLEKECYSRKSTINLYKQRWGVEEAYKTLKARLDVIHFSGKTINAFQ